MKANHWWGLLLFGGVLAVSFACDDDGLGRASSPRPQALSDSIEVGYERLRRAYAAADTLPPDVHRMRGAMGRMHEQMRHHRPERGGRMRQGGGMHGRQGRHGGQGMHGRGMHDDQRAGAWRDSSQMWEWHQQMMGMHAQMARMHRDSGMARRHRQMQRRHRQMMNALPSTDDAEPSERQQRAPSGAAVTAAAGESLYGQHCASCHGRQGAGLGPFPPLAGSEWVTGEEDTAIRVLLHGLQGRIEVAGRTYNNVMPAFGRRLSDDEVAALLSFVRSAWGNKAEAVSAEDVTESRRKHAGRSQPWTVSQLRDDE
jgi:mono/diheme cytochrome c family protein